MNKNKQRQTLTLISLGFLAVLNGCAGTPVQEEPSDDPLAGWNHGAQAFNDGLDDYVMKPLAQGYDYVMPDFAHHAVTNFFSNIGDISVTANDALQGNFEQSGEDGARLLVNTTAGIGGLIDVGSMLDLPKHNVDFDQTLGKWGVDPGPYLVLPIFGPSSPRGVAGILGDMAFNPISYTGIYFGNDPGLAYAVSGGTWVLWAANTRANNLGTERVISEGAVDRYDFIKNAYIAHRKYMVEGSAASEQQEKEEVLKYLQDEQALPHN